VEEYESANEELKAAHEEVMSMNEELQSANEELETSKEELQSLNEELTTVNNQLQDKVEELERANSDIQNLLASSEVMTVFLDTDLRIKRFTPSSAKLLNLLATDIDRPIADLAPKFRDDALLADCRAVLDKLTPIEKEVWSDGESDATAALSLADAQQPDSSVSRCYLRRILPYRTADNHIDGVVITLVDITGRIASEAQARRLAAVLNDSNYAITVQDFEGRIVAWNRGAERMYGYPEADALRMNIRDTVPENKRDEALVYVQSLMRDQPVQAFPTQRVTKDGRILDVELMVAAYRDERGQPIGVATTERDITDRKRLAEHLQELNATLEQRVAEQTREVKLLAEAISHLGEGVLITADDLNWPGPKILFVNDALCRITGYARGELVGQTPRILQGERTSRTALDQIKQELTAGRSALVETVNYRKDGAPYDAELFITPLFDAQGRRTNFVSIHRDISERKLAERRVRESEERLRAILNAASDAIITIDEQGLIQGVNPATERMFGHAGGELVGQNVKVLMPPPYRDEHEGYIKRYLETGEARIIGIGREVRGRRKDGSTFPIDLTVNRVDHLRLFTGMIRDISERKALQADVLNILKSEQRRIGQELHDSVQQQLTGLGLIAQSLAETLSAKEPRLADEAARLEMAKRAERVAQGITKALHEVHVLARGLIPVQVDAGGLVSALSELASATSQLTRPAGERPGQPLADPVPIQCLFQCREPVEVADNNIATHLYRIAQEAVTNAVKHGRGNRIEISLEIVDRQLRLKVLDNGCGMDDKQLKGLVSDSDGHRGLGLRTMAYRAGLMGGVFRVDRPPEGGTRVSCTIPI
jgi:two-component system, LuxR family, sensor kinase FixL